MTADVTAPSTPGLDDAAERVAREVRRGGSCGHLAKVSSLMDAFRPERGSARFADVEAALATRGVVLDPGWEAVRGSGVVHLTSTTEPADGAPAGAGHRLTVWTPGRAEVERAAGPVPEPEPSSVLWFDLDPLPRRRTPDGRTVRPHADVMGRRADEVVRAIGGACPGLEVDMVRDLLEEDLNPKVDAFGHDLGPVRAVSAVCALARETHDEDDHFDGTDEELVLQLVEIVVGPGWLVTCWHPARVIRGAQDDPPETALLQEAFLCRVRHLWLKAGTTPAPASSVDLGTFLVKSLLDTYDASHRMMEGWLATWEVEFYTSLRMSDRAERLRDAAGELSDSLYMTAEIRRRLTSFLHARSSTGEKTWFPRSDGAGAASAALDGPTGSLEAKVRSHKENFDRLAGDIRANMDVLMLQSTATQQESTERVQTSLAWITGVVLVPTLVVGFFGANVRLPGGGAWWGFEVMVALMLGSALVVFVLIRRLTHGPRPAAPRPRSVDDHPPDGRA